MHSNWVPMRWPAEWREPAMLKLLEGTAINCLLVPQPADPVAQVVEAARKRGLAVFSPGDTSVAWLSRADVSSRAASSVLAFGDGVWPSIKLSGTGEKDTADAGPTGVPWIDSNGWFVQLARTISPASTVWIVADPPEERGILTAEAYGTAIADAAAGGGRWVLSLDARLRRELAGGESQALASWRKITRMLAFFETHKDWRTWRPMGVLAVLSDFSGPNEFLSTEALNLIARRQVPVRVFDKTKPGDWSCDGLKAVLYADGEPPATGVREKLLAFVRSGGLLICTKACSELVSGRNGAGAIHSKFSVYRFDNGRIAVAKTQFDDPYVLAADVHLLLSRANDVIRVWNAGTVIFHCAAAPGGGRAVIHLVSYTQRPMEYITLGVRGQWRPARFWTPYSDGPVSLKRAAADGMTEFHLPPVSMCAAVEVEGA